MRPRRTGPRRPWAGLGQRQCFGKLGAGGGVGGLTVVTTAPLLPRLAGLRTVRAFGGVRLLWPPSPEIAPSASQIPLIPTPPSPPPCKGRTPDTSKGDDSPRLCPPFLARSLRMIVNVGLAVRCHWAQEMRRRTWEAGKGRARCMGVEAFPGCWGLEPLPCHGWALTPAVTAGLLH